MKKLACLWVISFTLALSIPTFPSHPGIRITIQPFGELDPQVIKIVKCSIPQMFQAEVEVAAAKEMPSCAYYAPRKRYRAEKMLAYLDEIIDGESTKILGLTPRDISTSNGDYADWGILGLGELEGPACIVSTARLQKNSTPEKLYDRLVRIVFHELGHTFGLDHCPTKGCLMEDAKGTLRTVDHGTGTFCPECREKLKGLIKPS